ncbi:MAG TPA: hypothetical protein VMZ53_33065 [Kofleriaceae bacterium]|nr:hypothetical protein [Kofleriaceae bacterium]
MRSLFAVAIAVIAGCAGCAGPSQQQLAETPSAREPARPYEAPPASTSDKDRERLTQQFEDMETAQRAHKEANQSARQAPPPPLKGQPTPKKKGVAEQATLPPKKKGVAEQAPVEQAPTP